MKKNELKKIITEATLSALNGIEVEIRDFDVSIAVDSKFGDYATNVAMVMAKSSGQPPRALAEKIADFLGKQSDTFASVQVAGPGFINVTLTDRVLTELAVQATRDRPKTYEGLVVVTEYSDPNPFKVLHVGHLYTSIVGDAISNLIRLAGGTVHEVNFGGDVGLHVAKTMYAIIQELEGEHPDRLKAIAVEERSQWMAGCYVAGTRLYDDDSTAHDEIMVLNRRIYDIHATADHTSELAQIYWTCREWSYDYFNAFYKRIGVKFEKYYPESQTSPLGLAVVEEQLAKGVYSRSDGAVVFEGESHGLHTRVFITSQGLPTYEAKDVGLIMAKWRDYKADWSIVITGNDITEYMKVVLKSVEQFNPELAKRTRHITHGNVKLAGGQKMSSRKGNFLRAVDVLDMVAAARAQLELKPDERVEIGAIRYSFLKHRIGSDLAFVPEESVSLDGNSGPYLQYAHARARSILSKSSLATSDIAQLRLMKDERLLIRKIVEYPEVLAKAVEELMPHYIGTYLYELAQTFNRFYENNRVIGDEREAVRLTIVTLYADVLKDGLEVFGVVAPELL